MLSGAKRNRNISDFSGSLGFLASLGMTLGICEIFNAQALNHLLDFQFLARNGRGFFAAFPAARL